MNTEVTEQTFNVGSPARLKVRNVRGKVELIPGADGVIKIEVTTHLDDGNPDYTQIELNQHDSGEVEARVRTPENSFGIFNRKPLRVDFKIEVPAQTNVDAKIVSGDIHAHGFTGSQHLASVSGSLHLKDLSGTLDLDSVSGKIKGENLSGKGDISVVSGRMELTDCAFTSLKSSTVSGIKLNAVSGTLTLAVPKDTHCDASASAISGRFYTDLNVSQSKVSKRNWKVRIGQGGPRVKMSTVSGKMRLLSSFDATGSVPNDVLMTHEARKDVLDRLQGGEISVEDALKELG
ncbi:MAG: DUF4097 family beta strand repeat-containing protein [Anaerolineales bacterium]